MKKHDNGIQGFMGGRNGMDHLSRLLLYIALGIFALSVILRLWVLFILGGAVLGICIYRTLSKNLNQRYSENRVYLQLTKSARSSVHRFILRIKDKKTHRIFKCPNCSQKIRVPKGKVKILIKCPGCRIEFRENTGTASPKT